MMELAKDRVIVTDMDSGDTMIGSIFIPNDDGKRRGIKPRWSKVYKVAHNVTDVSAGEWILLPHGRWSQMFEEYDDEGNLQEFWVADHKAILAVSDEKPTNQTIGYDD